MYSIHICPPGPKLDSAGLLFNRLSPYAITQVLFNICGLSRELNTEETFTLPLVNSFELQGKLRTLMFKNCITLHCSYSQPFMLSLLAFWRGCTWHVTAANVSLEGTPALLPCGSSAPCYGRNKRTVEKGVRGFGNINQVLTCSSGVLSPF